MAALTAGLVEMEVIMRLSAALLSPACASARLFCVPGEITASAERQLGPSAVHSRPERAVNPLREGVFTPVLDMSKMVRCQALS